MNLVDVAFAPLRAVLGTAERDAGELVEVQARAADAIGAIEEATQSIEAHVRAIENLAGCIPELVEAVKLLTVELGTISEAIKPVLHAEEDVSRVSHLLGRLRGG